MSRYFILFLTFGILLLLSVVIVFTLQSDLYIAPNYELQLNRIRIYTPSEVSQNVSLFRKVLGIPFRWSYVTIELADNSNAFSPNVKVRDGFLSFLPINEPVNSDITIVINDTSLLSKIKKCESTITVLYRINDADQDFDGIPDISELRKNRANVIDWFVMIAESLYMNLPNHFFDIYQDCAGFIQFCFIEALKKHDQEWMVKYNVLYDHTIADKRTWFYPFFPLIEKKIFRVTNDSYSEEKAKHCLSLVNGTILRTYNMFSVGRDVNSLEKGDVVFFFIPENVYVPSHSMIYNGEGSFIYHTGNPGKNQIRKTTVETLMKALEGKFSLSIENKRFLGIFRWNMLY